MVWTWFSFPTSFQLLAPPLATLELAQNTNFLRKLYHTYVSSEGGILGDKYNNDLRGLAEIDAHSVELALSVHYALPDITDGPLVKKSIRASWSLNKGMPVAPPEDILTEGVEGTKGQHGQKRQGEDKS